MKFMFHSSSLGFMCVFAFYRKIYCIIVKPFMCLIFMFSNHIIPQHKSREPEKQSERKRDGGASERIDYASEMMMVELMKVIMIVGKQCNQWTICNRKNNWFY